MKKVLRPEVQKKKDNQKIVPLGTPASSYPIAELSYLRGDFDAAGLVLRKRLSQSVQDFQTHNLYGATLAQGGQFQEAEKVFLKLRASTKSATHKEKASFNLGLVQFYQDLQKTGDISVSKTAFSTRIIADFVIRPGFVPFENAIQTWQSIKKSSPNANVVLTYLSFAHLQHGDIDKALSLIIQAMERSESFYASHYVAGKVFLDLYLLGLEENDYFISKKAVDFFEIEPAEVLTEKDGLSCVIRETLLELAMQALHAAREMSPYSPEVLLGLYHAYMLAGMYEEAHMALMQAESIAPESLGVLDGILRFYEHVQNPPETIEFLMQKLKKLNLRKMPVQVQYLMPSYYLI
ncbi:MAG: hypothetical protein H6510_02960 [Acidobacteria bacterium]|nr:hypothetical protein [Acidobacteriota bacterium]MCB9396757.1 hypothetical protein [Acidobacteriota bacterium]